LTVQEGRDAGRTRVLLTAIVVARDGATLVRVRDISPAGARVDCDVRLPANSDVIFRRGELFVAARVAWSDQKSAGLRFYRKIEELA
jgi:hypothetical protein